MRVLVVEDDPGMKEAFQVIFEKAGFEIEILGSPNAILDNRVPLPDIYILDKQLSGVDGLDVCRFLKRQDETRNVPVIIVSAAPHIGRLAQNALADGFLEKPFQKQELLELVRKCLSER